MTPFTFTIDLPDLPPVGNCHRCVYTKIGNETSHTNVSNDDKTFFIQVNPGDRVVVKVWFINDVKWRCNNHFGYFVEGTIPTNYYPQWCWEFTAPQEIDGDVMEVHTVSRPRPGKLTK